MKLTASFRGENVAQAQESSAVLFLASISSVVCSLGGCPVFWINPSAGDGRADGWMNKWIDGWMGCLECLMGACSFPSVVDPINHRFFLQGFPLESHLRGIIYLPLLVSALDVMHVSSFCLLHSVCDCKFSSRCYEEDDGCVNSARVFVRRRILSGLREGWPSGWGKVLHISLVLTN